MICFTFYQIKKKQCVFSLYFTVLSSFFPPSDNPPDEPAVEAPPIPPLSDDEEEEIEDEQLDEAQYDSLEKASTPPGDYWVPRQFKPAVGGSLVPPLPSAVQLWFSHNSATI